MNRGVLASSLAVAAFAAVPVLHGAAAEEGSATWEGVNGADDAPDEARTQINQTGTAFACLKQNDPNLTSPPLAATCTDNTTATQFTSHFPNAPFTIDDYIQPASMTCPNGAPGGPLTARDAAVRDLSSVYTAKNPYGQDESGPRDR